MSRFPSVHEGQLLAVIDAAADCIRHATSKWTLCPICQTKFNSKKAMKLHSCGPAAEAAFASHARKKPAASRPMNIRGPLISGGDMHPK